MSAPVPNTCPIIDEVIDGIRDGIKTLRQSLMNLEDGDPGCSQSDLESAIEHFEGMIPPETSTFSKFFRTDHLSIEKVRQANSELREWGERMESELEEVKQELSIAESRIQELEGQIQDLTSEA